MSDRVPDPTLMARLQLSIKGVEWVAGLLAPYQDRPYDGGWTPRQHLLHLTKTEEHVHGIRIAATLREHRPVFEEWDENAAMLPASEIDEDITLLASRALATREASAALLRQATPADWTRTALWTDGNEVDLAWISYRTLFHGLQHFSWLLDALTLFETKHSRLWGLEP